MTKIKQLNIQIEGKKYQRWKTYWMVDNKLTLIKSLSYKIIRYKKGKKIIEVRT